MSVRTVCTPTSSYRCGIRCAGFGRYSGETRPSEVESPMCATERQDVRSGAPPGAAGDADGASAANSGRAPVFVTGFPAAGFPAADVLATDFPAAGVLATDLLFSGRTEPVDRYPLFSAGAGPGLTRPAPPTISTAPAPATAAMLPSPAMLASPAGRTRQPVDRARVRSRPRAPWRTGSSMNRQDSAARITLAATWSAARGRSSPELAGEDSTMTG